MDIAKYIGRTVEVIYQNDKGDITQRKVHINKVTNGCIRVFCMTANAPRSLKINSILAINPKPVIKRVI
ncbi:hypothetical protein [Paenibacillus sp. GCM10027626]|uniref:hypothetical protein n=1 Tax=Paenibacillus sp. GCM10027626 TaxID=3273411 RepID=UPI003645B1E9